MFLGTFSPAFFVFFVCNFLEHNYTARAGQLEERSAKLGADLGKATDAERIQRDAMSSCRAALGDGHPDTLFTITHLTGLLRAQQKLSEAEPLAREAREIPPGL